jgi:hypothetical protein
VKEDKPIQDFDSKAERGKPLGITRRKCENNISVKVKRNLLRIFVLNLSVRDQLRAMMDKVVIFGIP